VRERRAGEETQVPASRGARLHARAEALATRRNAVVVLVLAGAALLAVFAVRPTYPNYDSYYSLLWGQDLADGRLPDYDVFRTPTPHPLATLVAALLSPLGGAADRVFVLITMTSFLVLVALLFRFTQVLLGTLLAIVAAAIVLTRTDLEFFALRGVVDVPFLTFVFGAALVELRRPRAGWPVLALLALAGLVRPEAWVLSGAYLLWLAPAVPRGRLLGYAALAASAPVLWTLSDLAVTGDPLYSLTSTREVAGQVGRQRDLPGAISEIPTGLGGSEKVVNVAVGGLGLLLALWLLRRRAALPLAIGALGLAVFLGIATAGLSVIPRYLLIPSLFFNLGVAVALTGWAVMSARGRRGAEFAIPVALAVVAVAVMAFRAPSYVTDVKKLNSRTLFIGTRFSELKEILDHPKVVPLLERCAPITVPQQTSVPIVRYQTGLPKQAIEASIQQRRPPERGLLITGRDFNLEPAAQGGVGSSERSVRKWWSNYALSTFQPVARNEHWNVYARCD
jgi:hypothetical protein